MIVEGDELGATRHRAALFFLATVRQSDRAKRFRQYMKRLILAAMLLLISAICPGAPLAAGDYEVSGNGSPRTGLSVAIRVGLPVAQ
jgi:hypothetical protein